MYLVFAEEMRRIDQTTIESFGIPGQVLMENAGRGATRWFLEQFPAALNKRIGILAGRGNNGGDGFVMARYLFQKGAAVTVYLLAEKERVAGDALINLNLAEKMGVPIIEIDGEDAWQAHQPSLAHQQIWIDAVLGTGLTSAVKGFFQTVIEFINQSKQPVFAVDIPSGLDADTGRPHGVCVKAAATATFGLAKPGQILFPGAEYTGRLKIIDIGVPPSIVELLSPKKWLLTPALLAGDARPRRLDAHKGDGGHLLIVAGAVGATGAAALATMAGLRSGAGLATLACPAGINTVLEPMVTEAMTLPVGEPDSMMFDDNAVNTVLDNLTGKACVAVGPGVGTSESTTDLVKSIVAESTVPIVVDADGLNCLAMNMDGLKSAGAPIVITPHPGEMARLSGLTTAQVQADRIACARLMAEKYDVHVVLKGAGTVIAHPDGSVFINRTGNPGMAVGGMGDVLTGLIAGLISQGYAVDVAVRVGVFLHGAAADDAAAKKGCQGYLASEVLAAVPRTLTTILDDGHDRTATASFPETDELA
jgi:ADP-dependent NAD(P)H-hydrate dehydratase / NAD(P)H-hydrate epimerase